MAHGIALCDEYAARFPDKTHASLRIYDHPAITQVITLLPNNGEGTTPFMQIVTPGLERPGDPVGAYRDFYELKPYVPADWRKVNQL